LGYFEFIAARFQILPEILDAMTVAEQEAANFQFLDIAVSRGDKIILSNSAFEAKVGTSFYKELQYLYNKGYKAAADGLSLIK